MAKRILVSGGGGYIGSHCVVEIIKAGYDVLIIDNWSNSSKDVVPRLERITGKTIPAIDVDVRDKEAVRKIFQEHQFFAVLHLAAFKAVGESWNRPLDYFVNNVTGTLNILTCMQEFNIKNFVFSSSATVHGDPIYLPFDEKHPTNGDNITNPYGKSKYIVEQILRDLYKSDNSWNILILRYFNPAGAHESGLIGEDPRGIPHNLMPNISLVALGKSKEFLVFGNDFKTRDGTGIRDYLHVQDLAVAHTLCLKKIEEVPGLKTYCLGTGTGYTVLEMVQAFEKASGIKIPYRIVERRAGDIDIMCADSKLAEKELGWKAARGLDVMSKDLWNWVSKNPEGYATKI